MKTAAAVASEMTEPPTCWLMEIIHEPDQSHIPVQNVERIMRRVLDQSSKIERDAKALVQECVSEFIGLVTDDAKLFMEAGARKTVTGPDVVLALEDLWFKPYADLVRLFQWPDKTAIADESAAAAAAASRKRKRSDRPPLPLDQQQYAGGQGLVARWRGVRSSSSSSSSDQANGADYQPHERNALCRRRFTRVLTINDLFLPTPPLYHHRHAAAASASPSMAPHLIRTGSLSSSQTSASVNHHPIGNIGAGNVTSPYDDDGASCEPIASASNVTTAMSPIGVDLDDLILERHADVYDGMMTAPTLLLPKDNSRIGDESRPAQELRAVLSSPKMTTFPKSETLRTQNTLVRSMDPFSIDVINQFGIDLEPIRGNATLALDAAFRQLAETAPACSRT